MVQKRPTKAETENDSAHRKNPDWRPELGQLVDRINPRSESTDGLYVVSEPFESDNFGLYVRVIDRWELENRFHETMEIRVEEGEFVRGEYDPEDVVEAAQNGRLPTHERAAVWSIQPYPDPMMGGCWNDESTEEVPVFEAGDEILVRTSQGAVKRQIEVVEQNAREYPSLRRVPEEGHSRNVLEAFEEMD